MRHTGVVSVSPQAMSSLSFRGGDRDPFHPNLFPMGRSGSPVSSPPRRSLERDPKYEPPLSLEKTGVVEPGGGHNWGGPLRSFKGRPEGGSKLDPSSIPSSISIPRRKETVPPQIQRRVAQRRGHAGLQAGAEERTMEEMPRTTEGAEKNEPRQGCQGQSVHGPNPCRTIPERQWTSEICSLACTSGSNDPVPRASVSGTPIDLRNRCTTEQGTCSTTSNKPSTLLDAEY